MLALHIVTLVMSASMLACASARDGTGANVGSAARGGSHQSA